MPNTSRIPDHKEAALFIFSALLCWLYVIGRALWMPLVHDEANSFFHFIHAGSWIPFMAKWDAANHVLAMGMGKLAYTMFGPSAFALRAFAVLCYPLVAWSSWRLGARVADPVVRWCLWAALLATPFVLEFFSLFRGYGPSFAFMLWAIAMGLEFHATRRTRFVAGAALALGLGVGANLSLLPFWAVGVALLAVGILNRSNVQAAGRKSLNSAQVFALLGFGVAPGLYMIAFAMGLRGRDLLYYGSDRGLLAGSFASLRERLVPDLPDVAGIAICVALLLIIVTALFLVFRHRAQQRYPLLVLVSLLLIAEFSARWVLGEVFGVLYPKDRAMLHLVPLLLIAFAAALDRLAMVARGTRYMALFLLLLPAYTIATANFHQSTQWPEESIADAMYTEVRHRQAESERGLLLIAASPLSAIWDHKLLSGGEAFATVYPSDTLLPWADLLLADARKPERWEGRFKVLLSPNGSGQWLLEPLVKFERQLVSDSIRSVPSTNSEFTELYASEPEVQGSEGLVVDLSATLAALVQAEGELMLVVQMDAVDGSRAFYHAQRLDRQWSGHDSRACRSVIAVPRAPRRGDRLVVFVWNPDAREFSLRDARLRIDAIMGPSAP